MRIGPLGTRELVPLALLIIAGLAALSVTFLRADNEPQRQASERLNPGATGGPSDTPTAVPDPQDVEQPDGWILHYHYVSGVDGSLISGPLDSTEELDLTIDGPPFMDMRDGNWAVVAQGNVNAPAGEWRFDIEYRGAVKVSINEMVVAEGESAEVATLSVATVQPEGSATLMIEGRDTAGEFVLRWAD